MSANSDPLLAAEAAEIRGELGVAVTAYERLLRDADAAVAAEARFRLGRVAWRQGRYDDALAHYAAAAVAAQALGLENLRARVENGVGAVHYARGAYAQARASYGVARSLAAGDAALRGKVLLNLGVIANIEGDLDAARTAYRESGAAFAEAGDDAGRALVLHNLGMINADLAMWDEAAECYAECLRICEQQGNRQMVANVLLNQSELHIAAGLFDVAVAHCDRAMIIYVELGDEPGRGDALRSRSRALRLAGRTDDAAANAHEALRIAEKLASRLLEAEATREIGLIHRATGEGKGEGEDKAVAALRRALALFTELGATREIGEVRAEIEGETA